MLSKMLHGNFHLTKPPCQNILFIEDFVVQRVVGAITPSGEHFFIAHF